MCKITWWDAEHDRHGNLVVHHLVGGPGRSDEPCNLLKVCALCHDSYHVGSVVWRGEKWPRLTMGMLLKCKLESAPGEYDLERLLALAGYVGAPDKWAHEELPERFKRERARRGAARA